MTALEWDAIGGRFYETGVDRGVLYIPNTLGVYDDGVAWSGLTTVTESPSGAESNPQYADNIKYIDLRSAEEYGGTIEAYYYPDEFGRCDGTATVNNVGIGQQARRTFGLCYRTLLGNDLEATDYGYKLHLVYGATAAPSEQGHASVNDSPEAVTFSWEFTTVPAPVGTIDSVAYKPTSSLTIDSTKVDSAALAVLEAVLYGSPGIDPALPTPAEVIELFDGTVTEVTLVAATAPAYNTGTHVVTIPVVTGVTWKINGVDVSTGAQAALTVGQTSVITSHLAAGYVYSATSDNDWSYSY